MSDPEHCPGCRMEAALDRLWPRLRDKLVQAAIADRALDSDERIKKMTLKFTEMPLVLDIDDEEVLLALYRLMEIYGDPDPEPPVPPSSRPN